MSLAFCFGCHGTEYGLKCSGLVNGDMKPQEKERVWIASIPLHHDDLNYIY